jgi:hypothetical protein
MSTQIQTLTKLSSHQEQTLVVASLNKLPLHSHCFHLDFTVTAHPKADVC